MSDLDVTELSGLYRDLHRARAFDRLMLRAARRGRIKGYYPSAGQEGLAAVAEDWAGIAREIRRKRFGLSPPGDYRERARQARFLQYRGFSAEQVRAALGPGEDIES